MEVAISVDVESRLNDVWTAWTTPEHIVQWNFATDEWCCPSANIDLSDGGQFSYRMEAKDGSMGFDFNGKFTRIIRENLIQYTMDDGRNVVVSFSETVSGVKLTEIFEAEDTHTAEQQRLGWQAILNNFKSYVESNDTWQNGQA